MSVEVQEVGDVWSTLTRQTPMSTVPLARILLVTQR